MAYARLASAALRAAARSSSRSVSSSPRTAAPFDFMLGNNLEHHHRERRLVSFPQEHVFRVVANVDEYKHFVPWCIDSRVRTRSEDGRNIEADLAAGFQLFSEQYTSRVTLQPFTSVIAEASNTQLFRKLRNEWGFAPGPQPHTCWLSFKVEFEFRSALYAHVSGLFMDEVVNRMVAAFDSRCALEWQRLHPGLDAQQVVEAAARRASVAAAERQAALMQVPLNAAASAFAHAAAMQPQVVLTRPARGARAPPLPQLNSLW